MRRAAPLVLALVAAGAICGCSSTREKASKFAADGNAAFRAKGLRVTRSSGQVRVVARTIVHDANGTAVVVSLRNETARTLRNVPVALTLLDARGRAVYRNDAPGLQSGLVSAPLIGASKTVQWVNDQVQPSATPARLSARVGSARAVAGTVPALKLGRPRLEGDATSGIAAVGTLRNTTAVAQPNVVVTAVATKARRVVAAGRAIVPRVAPGRVARFSVFFVGDPRGARLSLAAPPTVIGR